MIDFCKRVHGVNTFAHSFDSNAVRITELPYMFKDWKEYRDYLLIHLVKEEYWELFRNRWKDQNSEEWYKVHCQEIVANDIDGTKNANHKSAMSLKERTSTGRPADYNEIIKRLKGKK